MKKKIISAVLAGACAVSAMGLNVSAAVTNKAVTAVGTVTLTAAGTLLTPKINVSVPSAIGAFINPYGVGIENPGSDPYTPDGVQSPIYTIMSMTSSSNVSVGVTPTITVPVLTLSIEGKDANEKTVIDKTTTYSSIAVVDSAAGLTTDDGYEVIAAGDLTEGYDGSNWEDEAKTATASVPKAVYAYVIAVTSKDPVELVAKEDVTAAKKNGASSTVTNDDVNATVKSNVYTPDLTKVENVIGNETYMKSADAQSTDKSIFNPDNYKTEIEVASATFVDNTAVKIKGKAVDKSEDVADAKKVVAVLTKAEPSGDLATYTYCQFAISGDVTKADTITNTADAWAAKDKITFSVVLDLQPTAKANLAAFAS